MNKKKQYVEIEQLDFSGVCLFILTIIVLLIPVLNVCFIYSVLESAKVSPLKFFYKTIKVEVKAK